VSRSTDGLIRELTQSLAPVRPVARLHRSIGWVIAVAVPVNIAWLYWTKYLGIPRPERSLDGIFGMPYVFMAVLGVLVLLAFGGLVAGLADGIPGREALARRSRWLTAAAALVAFMGFVVVVVQVVVQPGTATAFGEHVPYNYPYNYDYTYNALQCGRSAALLALAPLALCLRAVWRGTSMHPSRMFYVACVGTVAITTAAVHASCPNLEAAHQWLGHGLAPIFAGAVLWVVVQLIILTLPDERAPGRA